METRTKNIKWGGAVLGRTTLGKHLVLTRKFQSNVGLLLQKEINKKKELIRRIITYKEKQKIASLYKAIVRPHLEYCIQAWRPCRNKDIYNLEKIQRRATKMNPELRDLSYESLL